MPPPHERVFDLPMVPWPQPLRLVKGDHQPVADHRSWRGKWAYIGMWAVYGGEWRGDEYGCFCTMKNTLLTGKVHYSLHRSLEFNRGSHLRQYSLKKRKYK